MSKKYVMNSYAFLAACFFMFQSSFLFTEYYARSNIAVLFLALSLMVLFDDNINDLSKRVLFMVFIISCIVSHYTTAYIFFFSMFIFFLSINIFSLKIPIIKPFHANTIIFFFIALFLWYSSFTHMAFNASIDFLVQFISKLNDLFINEMRGTDAQSLLGAGLLNSTPYKISFIYTWLTFIFIAFGVITALGDYCRFSKSKFDSMYLILTLIYSGMCAAILFVPFFSTVYGMERLYPIALIILSVFFIIGGTKLSKAIGIKRSHLLILSILIPYFICSTGIIYNLFGIPNSIILNSEGDLYNTLYVHDQESYCANWIQEYVNEINCIFGDNYGSLRLVSQGGVNSSIMGHSSIENINSIKSGYIYLGYTNIALNKTYDTNIRLSDLLLKGRDRIYTNGGSEVLSF